MTLIGLLVRSLLSWNPPGRADPPRNPAGGSQTRAERRASLMEPRAESLMARVDSKFTLVTLSAMRAREINDYYNQLGEGLGKIVPPQVTSVSRKPLSIAMEEIEVGKIESVPLPTEEELAAAAAAKAAAALPADLPTPTLPATGAPVLGGPAMRAELGGPPAVRDTLAPLRRRGVQVADPAWGRLAGGAVGEGRLADPADIVAAAETV